MREGEGVLDGMGLGEEGEHEGWRSGLGAMVTGERGFALGWDLGAGGERGEIGGLGRVRCSCQTCLLDQVLASFYTL